MIEKSTMATRAKSNTMRALDDIRGGFDQRELWLYLGWREIKSQYSRSIIGPLWLTLSMGMMVLGLGVLYSQILKIDVANYLPRLAIGLIVWGLINGIIIGACRIFAVAGGAMRQIKMPVSMFIFQFIWSQLLVFAHNFLIYIIIAIVFLMNPGWNVLLFFPALLLVVLSGFFISMILGPLCARFRDVPMIIGSVMQIVFFMTPIIWSADQMPSRAWVLTANPFYHFIEIIRDPLLGKTGTALNWTASVGITIALGAIATVFFARYRARVVYWS
ncbi:ABC transporter permease [Rhizobium anhuiense]